MVRPKQRAVTLFKRHGKTAGSLHVQELSAPVSLLLNDQERVVIMLDSGK